MLFEFFGFSWGGAVAATAATTATVSAGTGTVALGAVAVGTGTALTAETIASVAILGLSVVAAVGVNEADNAFDSGSSKDNDKMKKNRDPKYPGSESELEKILNGKRLLTHYSP